MSEYKTPEDEFILSKVQFEVDGIQYKFEIVHNLPDHFGLSLKDALTNWIYRTKEYTVESLCDYINSKNTEYEATPRQPWHVKI